MVVLMAIIATTITSEVETDADRESGLLGWGVGLEMPILGVTGGLGTTSDFGAGFTFGGAVDYELTPSIGIRLLIQYTKSIASEAGVVLVDVQSQSESESRIVFDVDADYVTAQSSLGARYTFVGDRSWAPYLGFDGGLVYGGYNYNLVFDAESLRSVNNAGNPVFCEILDCQTGTVDRNQLTWGVSARAGVQFQLAPWLRSAVEISVEYIPLDIITISDTVRFRNVTSADEELTLLRINYTIRWEL